MLGEMGRWMEGQTYPILQDPSGYCWDSKKGSGIGAQFQHSFSMNMFLI